MANNNKSDLLSEVANYYSAKLAEHGDSPQGVDWNGEEGQILRFKQLAKVISIDNGFSVNDLGCGYGALYDFLRQEYEDVSYTGCDVSADMINKAISRNVEHAAALYLVAGEPPEVADYGIASGIFNVRMERNDAEWQAYIEETLNTLDRTSRRGFSFNCLTSYSDAEKMQDYLYYADPCRLFDHCKRHYSRNVALLHDYGLYEFTLIVRKDI